MAPPPNGVAGPEIYIYIYIYIYMYIYIYVYMYIYKYIYHEGIQIIAKDKNVYP